MIKFTMPSLGADMEAGTLVEWLVKPGDKVKRNDVIAVVETQKGLIDIEVFDEGFISELLVKETEKVPVGTVLALINPGEIDHANSEINAQKLNVTEEAILSKTINVAKHTIKASPLAKRIAEEKGIDLTNVIGTGEDGAITKDDVENEITNKIAPIAKDLVTAEQKTNNNMRMAVAAAMAKSNREIPHYYLAQKVDMSKALTFLRESNSLKPVKLRQLPVVLLIKAVAKALIDVPDLNAYWENGIQIKTDINIGFVVSLRNGGLMIPAIQNADKISTDEIMAKLNDIIPRARTMKLRSSDLSESTITITSMGENNAETVFGIIYPPQVALVGFGSIIQQPWVENGMLGIRPVINVTLAADHRATDGATGSRFLMAIKAHLQNPEKL